MSNKASPELPGSVLQGAMVFSSSMLKGKLTSLNASIVANAGLCLKSFTAIFGIFADGTILKTPELIWLEPSLTTLPTSHMKLADSRSRLFFQRADDY